MAQTTSHVRPVDSDAPVSLESIWAAAARSRKFAIDANGNPMIARGGMIASVPVPNLNDPNVAGFVVQAILDAAKTLASGLNGESLQGAVNSTLTTGVASTARETNDAREYVYRERIAELTDAKYGFGDVRKLSEEKKKERQARIEANVNAKPLRDKHFDTAVAAAIEAGLKPAAKSESKRKTGTGPNADMDL